MTSLPDGWGLTTLGEVTTSEIDRTGPEGARDFLYVDISSVDNHTKTISSPKHLLVSEAPTRARQRLRPGDVLVSMTRPNLNAVAIVPENMKGAIGSTGLHVLRAANVNPMWLYYFVQTNDFVNKMSESVQGVIYPAVRPKGVEGCEIPLAPLDEQRRIVAEIEKQFSRLDAGVVALDFVRKNLERCRASVLKAACEGRLVPTEAHVAEAEGRKFEAAEALLNRTPHADRPNRYASRSREVIFGHAALAVGDPGTQLPKGWGWAPLVHIAKMESGHTPSRRHVEWWGGDIAWITLPDARAHHGGVILDTAEHTNELGLENSAARLLPAGTVCISRTASVGYVVIMGKPMATSQDFVNWVPTAAINPHWLRIVFCADREVLRRFGKGSVHKTIYFPEWLSVHIAVPPLTEQERIVTEVDRRLSALGALAEAARQNRDRAGVLRKAILAHAFGGKLVSQDESDEPASKLLQRMREKQSAQPIPMNYASRQRRRAVRS